MPAPSSTTRILIVDDRAIFCEGLRLLLHRHPDLQVVGGASRPGEALALAAEEQPDVVLLDVDFSGIDGLDMIESLRAMAHGARIIVLTGMRTPQLQARCLRLGAKGFVPKESSADLLVRAIRRVAGGDLWFDRGVVSDAVSRLLHTVVESDDSTLTPRELELVRLVGEGHTNRVMARQLSVSKKKVRRQLETVFEKVGVHGRLDLAIYAYRRGIARLPQ